MGQEKKLFIGTPIYDGASGWFVQSLAAMITRTKVRATLNMKQGDSLVTRARNALSADFLASDCTHLLFIDSDLIFMPEDVERIASHDVPLVGGLYPLKEQGELKWCGNGLLSGEAETRPDGLHEVRYIGTGFMCIAREVFVAMILADGVDLAYQADTPPHRTEYDFWKVGVRQTGDRRRRYLSEDWYFCQRWLELGGKVFADNQVRLRHVGRATWPLQSQEPRQEIGPG